MGSKINRILEERFTEYKVLLKAKECYGAILRLAEIFNCLSQIEEPFYSKWTERLQSEQLQDEVIQTALVGLERNAERIRRVLSVGDVWNEDEILLILTKRIQIEMLLQFLKEIYSHSMEVFLDDIDRKVEEISASKQNGRTYKLVVAQLKRNWGLPIDSKWLRDE